MYAFWKVSPLEAIIWFAGMITTIFSSIENGIYVAVGLSGALLLYRVARPRGHFLGRVRIHDEAPEGQNAKEMSQRDVYVPLQPDGVRNPLVQVEAPPPGVIIYRFDEAFLYVNAAYYTDLIAEYARETTRSGTLQTSEKAGDRPWNDPGPSRWNKSKRAAQTEANEAKPVLRAVVFDFSSVSNIDSTSVQNLVDLRTVLERYSGHEVEFHFAAILSPWIKRALLAGGFGTGKVLHERPLEIAPVVPAGTEAFPLPRSHFDSRWPRSPPNGTATPDTSSGENKEDIEAAVNVAIEGPLVTPFTPRFHLDLPSAVAAAAGKEW